MAKVKPFKAIRPASQFQDVIPALPYDVYSRAEARDFVTKHPHSFLAIDRPETQLPVDADMYSQDCYDVAHRLLSNWIKEKSLVQDTSNCYYLYELAWEGHSQTGIVACASVDDYLNNVIKKHENTRAEKEQDRINHVYTCQAQTGPIFLSYKHNKALHEIIEDCKKLKPIYQFDLGYVKNKAWKLDDAQLVERIAKELDKVEALYIADGHHRCASAVKVAQRMREENPNFDGAEEFNWFLSVMFDADELHIMDYNRVVKDLNGLTTTEFVEKIKQVFDVVGVSGQGIKPGQKGEFAMYIDNIWYFLKLKDQFENSDIVQGMDTSILQNEVLDKILGIKDPKTDTRIDFVGGIRGLAELERRVQNDCVAAFALYPTSMDELFAVADAGLLMPPKSTWFEPKLLSGLFIHDISN